MKELKVVLLTLFAVFVTDTALANDVINSHFIEKLNIKQKEINRMTTEEPVVLQCTDKDTLETSFAITNAKGGIVRRVQYDMKLGQETTLFMWVTNQDTFEYQYLTTINKNDCIIIPRMVYRATSN